MSEIWQFTNPDKDDFISGLDSVTKKQRLTAPIWQWVNESLEDTTVQATIVGLMEGGGSPARRRSPRADGGIGDGETDDTDALSDCIDSCNSNGYVLDLSGGTWRTVGALPTITYPYVTSDGTGEIYVDYAATAPILNVAPAPGVVYTVTAVAESTFDFAGEYSNDTPVTRLTLSLTGGQTMPDVGSIGKLTATDAIIGVEAGDQVGQHCYVAAVSGSFVYIPWALFDTYSTSMQLVILSTQQVLLNNFSMRANWTQLVAADWNFSFVRVSGAISPVVDRLRFRDGVQGLDMWGNYAAITYGISATRMRNAVESEDPAVSGYAVTDAGSWGSTHYWLGGSDCRHVYTTISPDASTSDRLVWGRVFSPSLVGGFSSGCSAAAYDTHSDCVDPEFIGLRVNGTYYGESSAAGGFQFRGIGGRALDCRVRGGALGFQCQKQYAGEGHRHSLINCHYEGEGVAIRVEHADDLTGADARQTVRVRDFHGRTTAQAGVRLQAADLEVEGSLRIEHIGATTAPRALFMEEASTARSIGDGTLVHEFSAMTGTPTPRVITFEGDDCAAAGLNVQVIAGSVIWQGVVSENDDTPAAPGTFRINCDADSEHLSHSGGYSETGSGNLLPTGALQLRFKVDGGGPVVARTANFNVRAYDNGRVIPVTSAVTATISSAAILGPFFECWIQAVGVTVTIDGPGASNVSLTTGKIAHVYVLAGQTYVAEATVTQVS